MRGKWPLVAGGVVGLAIMAGIVAMMQSGGRRHALPQQTATQAAPAPAPTEVELVGTIQAARTVNIVAPVDGVVARFMAEAGDEVFEGELLANIKNPDMVARAQATELEAVKARNRVSDLDSGLIAARLEASRSRADATRAKAEFERAEKIYARQKLLYDQGATARLTYEKALSDFEQLKADTNNFEHQASAAEERIASLTKELETARVLAQQTIESMDSAKADLGSGEVHSPVDGIVVSRHGKEGDPVTTEIADLFLIGVDLSDLEVVVEPNAKVLAQVRTGAPVSIEVREAPGAIQGAVREIKDGAVFIAFKAPSPAVKPGLIAQIKIRL